MTFNLKPCAVASAVAALLASTTLSVSSQEASQEASRQRHQGKGVLSAGMETEAFGGLVAPNALLAGLFDAGGAPIRTKGVQSISRIGVGIYCVRPAASVSVNPNNSLVTATPEYFYSNLNEVQVQWASAGSGCPAGQIGIYTLADPNRDGIYTLSNAVGFSVLVP